MVYLKVSRASSGWFNSTYDYICLNSIQELFIHYPDDQSFIIDLMDPEEIKEACNVGGYEYSDDMEWFEVTIYDDYVE